MYAVHTRLEIVTSERLKGVANVDSDGLVLRLDPLPPLLRVQDLQSSNWLPEEQCDTAEVSVSWRVQLADFTIQLRRAGGVVHVAEMILALDIVLVLLDELVFVFEFEDDGKETQKLHYDKIVTFSAEGFDLLDMVLENRRLGTLVVAIKLGKVVDLNVVLDSVGESDGLVSDTAYNRIGVYPLPQSSRAVAIILAIVQVLKIMILELFLEWQVVKLSAQSELAVDFFLADTEVLHIEETDMLSSISELLS